MQGAPCIQTYISGLHLYFDAAVCPFSAGYIFSAAYSSHNPLKKGKMQGKIQMQGAPCIQTYISGLHLYFDAAVCPFSAGYIFSAAYSSHNPLKKGKMQGKIQMQGAPCIQTYISGLHLYFDAAVCPFSADC